MIDRRLRVLTVCALFMTVLTAGFATPGGMRDGAADTEVPSGIALRLLLAELAAQPVAEWSGADAVAILELERAVDTERAYVERMRRLSWIAAGLGHLAADQEATGALYLGADIAIGAVATGVALALLPAPVRSDNLSYISAPFGEIEEAWKTVTAAELIPTATTLIMGGTLIFILRSNAADGAEAAARARLSRGWVADER